MSSLRVRGEPFQLFFKFVGSNVVELKNAMPPIQVKNVKEYSSSLKLYLQKVGLKDKSKHVEKAKPHPQIYLQKINFKIKVGHVEKH
jgi:hypothetical protein